MPEPDEDPTPDDTGTDDGETPDDGDANADLPVVTDTETDYSTWDQERLVKELGLTRKEAQKLRGRAKAFEDWDDEDQRDAWADLVRTAKENPGAGLANLMRDAYGMSKADAQAFLEAVYADDDTPAPDAGEGEFDDDLDRPMTRREFEDMKQAEQQKATAEKLVDGVKQQARDLGFNPDADLGTIENLDYRNLVALAYEKFNTDLPAAAKHMQEVKAAEHEKWLERKRKDAEDAPTPPQGAAGVVLPPSDGSWKGAKERAMARVRQSPSDLLSR